MKKYDVIIIGGGLAGATLGYLLKKQNKKVLIIEKQKISNKNKLCGGLLTKKSFNVLCDIFGEKKIINLIKTKFNKAVLNNNGQKLIIENVETFSIYRKKLDAFILNQYLSNNGEIIDNTNYQNINVDKNRIVINNLIYTYDYLVAADGVFSKVRKEITDKQQGTNFAYEINVKKDNFNLEISFFDNIKGYAWIIPNNDNVMVGMGEVTGKTKFDSQFNRYINQLKIKSYDKKGAFLPTGKDIYLKYKNIYFIGDSAGLISPITGEGIYYSLKSAQLLSKNISNEYLFNMKPIKKEIRKDLFYFKFVYNYRIRNYLFSKYNTNKTITKLINKFVKHIL